MRDKIPLEIGGVSRVLRQARVILQLFLLSQSFAPRQCSTCHCSNQELAAMSCDTSIVPSLRIAILSLTNDAMLDKTISTPTSSFPLSAAPARSAARPPTASTSKAAAGLQHHGWDDASPERLHDQSIELTQYTSGCRVATRLPQHPSLQSRSPQLLVDCLSASAGDAQAMLEGFPVR